MLVYLGSAVFVGSFVFVLVRLISHRPGSELAPVRHSAALLVLSAVVAVVHAFSESLAFDTRVLQDVLLMVLPGYALVATALTWQQLAGERETRRALELSRAEAASYLDVAGVMLVAVDRDQRVRLANRKCCETLGRDERSLQGIVWTDVLPEERAEQVGRSLRQFMAGGEPYEYTEYPVVHASGRRSLIAWHRTQVRDSQGRVTGTLSSGLDVTKEREAEQKLRFEAFLLDNVLDSVIIHDFPGNILYANEAACHMRQMTREALLGGRFADLVDPDFQGTASKEREVLLDKGSTIFEIGHLRADGTTMLLEVHAKLISYEGRTAILSVGRDITERKQAQSTIARMAYEDVLTGLANRALFLDRLDNALRASHRTGCRPGVLFLDVDHFKHVNDTLGHQLGDRLLCAVADRLRGLARASDTVGRLGGDEFVLLLPDARSEADVERLAAAVVDGIRTPFELDGHELCTSCSVGVAIAEPGETADSLIGRADSAMYEAKDAGKDAFEFYTPQLRQQTLERYALKADLARAIVREEFVVHYQPQVGIRDERIVGAEALLRWQHPRLGLVPPIAFIPLAEETGAIQEIGAWVLDVVTRQCAAWQEQGHKLRIGVNVSARQFMSGELAATVASALARSGLAPEHLELEITETVAMQDTSHMQRTFSELRRLGVQLAIDDFGTGYSSLNHLKRFPVHALKVDRSFIVDLTTDVDTRAITSTILMLAQNLGLRTVAEGVETEEQLELLRRQGCDEMQGYLCSPALPAERFTLLLGRDPYAALE